MLGALQTTGGTILLAYAIALVVGLSLGRIATQWFGGRGVTNILMEMRGGLLPFVVVPILYQLTGLPLWVLIGVVVGTSQAAAVARWVGRRSGEWSPALVGGIALGRSGAALVTRRAAARGAVSATLAMTAVSVVTLEGLEQLLFPENTKQNVGALLCTAGPLTASVVLAITGAAVLLLEHLSSRLLQRKHQSGQTL